MYLHLYPVFITFMYIQVDLRVKVNIFKVDFFGHCEINVHVNMRLSLNFYQVRAV
jgi:hypothetical protein